MKQIVKRMPKNLTLQHGSHASVNEGLCAMEAVAWLAGEKHSDAPECACPVITKYVITLNDKLNSDERQLLKPYLKRIIGTRDGNAKKRAKIFAMNAVTKVTPYAIEIKFPEHAKAMRKAKTLVEAKTAADAAANAAYAADAAADAAAANAAYAAADAAAAYAAYAAYAADAAAAAAAYAAYAAANAAANAADKKRRKLIVKAALASLDEVLKVK